MDYITKNKIVSLLVLMLCVSNFAVVIFILNVMPQRGGFMDHGFREGPMNSTLELTEQQEQKIFSLRQKQRDMLGNLFKETDQLRKDMVTLLFDPAANSAKAEEIAKKLGEQNAKFEMAQYENMRDIFTVLTPEQKKKLKELMDNMSDMGPMPPGGIFWLTQSNRGGHQGNGFRGPDGFRGPNGMNGPDDRFGHGQRSDFDDNMSPEQMLDLMEKYNEKMQAEEKQATDETEDK